MKSDKVVAFVVVVVVLAAILALMIASSVEVHSQDLTPWAYVPLVSGGHQLRPTVGVTPTPTVRPTVGP